MPVFLPEEGKLRLRVEASPAAVPVFRRAGRTAACLPQGEGCTQLLSTECMNCTFTGCFIGLFCQGEPGDKGPV